MPTGSHCLGFTFFATPPREDGSVFIDRSGHVRLNEIQIRFYKAFNYDYLRKFDKSSSARPWETMDDGSWYPFVTVSLEPDLTTVVGANESGKSQVLDAIEALLGEREVVRTDFCRYSKFFLVDRVERVPDLTGEFGDLSDDEAEILASMCGWGDERPDCFVFVRSGDGKPAIYWRDGDEWKHVALAAQNLKQLQKVLPRPFRLKSKVPLPNSVPLRRLADGENTGAVASIGSRARRQDRLNAIDSLPATARSSAEALAKHAEKFFSAVFAPLPTESEEEEGDAEQQAVDAERLALADQLLVDIAGVGRQYFKDVLQALRNDADGYVDGVEDLINTALASTLDFKRWWTQDKDFSLQVSIREADLAFVVGDRTGTRYSFSERSGGLSYFLSYFVQFLGHQPDPERSEILLMDEPDAYLSSQAQQDLLRILRAFAYPDDPSVAGCQVAYVTHSPFLIDRNRASAIRVVEKGAGDEGTRVVHDAARNHYEPLRSAFGSLVGESTFISGCNLMVEGAGDQVLLAGMARRLQSTSADRTEYLDLNSVTIVPAGGASQIPYLAFLARGRDVEKPAVIILLDADKAGDDARRSIRKGGAYRKPLVDADLVSQLNDDELADLATDRSDGVVEIEDLVPLRIAAAAAAEYLSTFAGIDVDLSQADFNQARSEAILDRVAALATADLAEPVEIQKVGFARHVLRVIEREPTLFSAADVETLDSNFATLFKRLTFMQREALRRVATSRVSTRFERSVAAFLDDHVDNALRTDVSIAFEEIGHALDDSDEGDLVRKELALLRRRHQLDVTPKSEVSDFDDLRASIERLPHLARLESSSESALAGDEHSGE